MKVAYLRVSSTSQSLEIQREAVSKLNIQKIFEEKVSGTSTKGRDKLKECLDFVREGDELVITRIDRLARSVLDLQLIVKELNDKGVILTATEQPISTKDATSKCFLDMLGVFAELETNLRKERQMEGIAKAKAKGVYKGGKKKINVEEIIRLKAEGYGATKIAKELNIHRDSVYRLLKKWSIKYNSFLAVELSGSGAMQPLISKRKRQQEIFTQMPQLSLQRQLSKKKSTHMPL